MSSPQEIPNAVDIAQASELTGLSKKALRRRLERGTLDSVKVGGKRMIPISELESHDLLDARSASAPSSGAGAVNEGSTATPFARPAVDPQPSSGPSVQATTSAPSSPPANAAATTAPSPAGTSPPVDTSAAQPAVASPPAPDLMPAASGPPTVPATPPSPAAPPVGVPAMGTPGYPPGQYVPGPGPYGAYPPERGAWYLWYRYPTLRWVLALLLLAAIALVVWLLAFRNDGGSAIVQPGGGPVGVTQEDLIALSQRLHEPIYWAGTMPGTRLELTETNNSYAYLRYLTEDTPVGDTSANFLTVGTYPSPNAYEDLRGYARGHSQATTNRIQNGGIAVVIPGSPTSVYFAYPHQDVQVEVYDPQQGRALDLVKSGVVRPVISSTSTAGAASSTGTPTVTVPTTTPSEAPTVPQG